METISNEMGNRMDFENLIQACLLTDAALPLARNAVEQEWLTDCLAVAAKKFSGIVERIENDRAKNSNNENGGMHRLTEDLIAKILWLDFNLPETLDREEKILLDRLLMREARFLDGQILSGDQNALREILHEMQMAVSWDDISVPDLQVMKIRGIINGPQYHYYLSRIAYSEEFA